MRMTKKVRNLGFSLVELIVAFTVLGVAMLGIGSLLVVATRSSSRTQEQSNVYNEAQLATNQMENIIQDTELAVSYRIDGAFALQDGDEDATEKVLYIFNAQTIDTPELILLKWTKATEEIYYREVYDFPTADEGEKVAIETIPVEPSGTEEDWALLAEYATTFSVTLDDANQKLFLDIQFGGRTASYESCNTITLRNSVVMNPENLSDVTRKITEEMLSEITDVQISMTPQILASTSAGKLDYKVSGKGTLPEYEVTWFVAKDAAMTDIVGKSGIDGLPVQIGEDGSVSIDFTGGLKTYTGAFYVKAVVTEEESGKSIESNVKEFKVVRDMKVSVAGTNHIASMNGANSGTYQMESGASLKMQCEVSGNGLSVYDQNVIWSIEDMAQGTNGSISADGILEIENYSIGCTMKVVATLAQNSAIRVEFPIKVIGTHNEGDTLFLRPNTTLANRGGEVRVSVELLSNNVDYVKDTVIKPEDCIWSVSVTPWLPANYLSVGTSGIVTVGEQIPWNEEYEVTVTATWKKDYRVTGTTRFIIPATTLGR